METTGFHGTNSQAKKRIALTLSGGGFKSVADQSGMAAGLLAVLMKRNPDLQADPSPLASSSLFADIDIITSISGGTWFVTSLVYSESFRIMIEDLARAAASNQESKNIFNSKYSIKFNNLAKNAHPDEGPSFLTKVKKAVEFFHKGDIPEEIEFGLLMATYLYQQGDQHVSWSSFVNHILMDDSKETMGGPVQEWSVGKVLAIVTSIIAPIPARIFSKAPFDRNYIWYKYNGNRALNMFQSNNLFYNVNQPENKVTALPARFSIILGADAYTPSPLPFGPSMLDNMEVNYIGSSSHKEGLNLPQHFTATSNLGLRAKHSDHESFYDSPLCGPVAASSAAIGGLTMVSSTARLFDSIQLDPSVWFASKLTGERAFDEPLNLTESLWKGNKLTQDMVDQIARIGMYALTDGGVTDAFGVATALAAGATDIFTINSMSSGFSVACHFSGYQYAQLGLYGSIGKVLRNNCWPIKVWKVFSEDQRFYNSEKEKFKNLDTNNFMENEVQSTSYLTKLSFGSMKVTTVKNEYFGIEEGRAVNLHVFQASGNVTLGVNQMFDDYGLYVQDIIATLTSEVNKDTVTKMLDSLAGKSFDEKDVMAGCTEL